MYLPPFPFCCLTVPCQACVVVMLSLPLLLPPVLLIQSVHSCYIILLKALSLPTRKLAVALLFPQSDLRHIPSGSPLSMPCTFISLHLCSCCFLFNFSSLLQPDLKRKSDFVIPVFQSFQGFCCLLLQPCLHCEVTPLCYMTAIRDLWSNV